MGLDIHAASNLRFARPYPESEEFERLEEEFSNQGKDIGDVYFFLSPNEDWEDHLAGMEPGLYEYTAASEQHSFRAGSYRCYNEWRDQVQRFSLLVRASATGGNPNQHGLPPFDELIVFTDCDGRIGTRVAATLAADFRAHAARAVEFAASLGEENDFLGNYNDFTTAFGLAAQNGALRFC